MVILGILGSTWRLNLDTITLIGYLRGIFGEVRFHLEGVLGKFEVKPGK